MKLEPSLIQCHATVRLVLRPRLLLGLTLALMLPSLSLRAFSLLGPYTPWMNRTIGYYQPGDIGGPVNVTEGYRWNVPVLTYAFDPSFLNYFGSNGVAAIEQAVHILNDLPPASNIVLTNFPTDSRNENFRAAYQEITDLKSATLALLVEHLGLGQPDRQVFAFRKWDPIFLYYYPASLSEMFWPTDAIPNLILERNFDPETLLPSHVVNDTLFSGVVTAFFSSDLALELAYVHAFRVDVNNFYGFALADFTGSGGWEGPAQWTLNPGFSFSGLTQDDAGGLRWLLSTNNLALEALLPDVHGADTNVGSYVDLALRPGIEKISFIRQDYDALLGHPTPITNRYTDIYFTNGIRMSQQVERVITQPDILFCAADTGEGNSWTPNCLRTGTSNWWNSAAGSGTTNAGPGVIRPPVRITFNLPGAIVETRDPHPEANAQQTVPQWGSFDNSTNLPIVYPMVAASGGGPMNVRLRLYQPLSLTYPESQHTFQWRVPNCAAAGLEVSSNLVDWATCALVTNHGALVEWHHTGSSGPREFFRVVPQ